jgi:DNA repair protein RecO (recombination protein O)
MAVSWEDRAIILATRGFGEHDAIVTVFGAGQGRYAGLVKGGAGRKHRSLLQTGNVAKVWWRARIEDQLGILTCEPLAALAGRVLDNPRSLAGLVAVCAMIDACLHEREPHATLFDATLSTLEILCEDEAVGATYVRWELGLLRELGFGLDLASCAVTGAVDGLAFVSPKSGRAVTRVGAGSFADRLLPLPAFMLDDTRAPPPSDIAAALRLTGHFLDGHVFGAHGKVMPAARTRFVELLKS